MSKLMFTVLAAVALAHPVSSVSGVRGSMGGERRSDCLVKQGSFVPHSSNHNHVYGSPIGQPILGHAKANHRPKPKTFKTF